MNHREFSISPALYENCSHGTLKLLLGVPAKLNKNVFRDELLIKNLYKIFYRKPDFTQFQKSHLSNSIWFMQN